MYSVPPPRRAGFAHEVRALHLAISTPLHGDPVGGAGGRNPTIAACRLDSTRHRHPGRARRGGAIQHRPARPSLPAGRALARSVRCGPPDPLERRGDGRGSCLPGCLAMAHGSPRIE